MKTNIKRIALLIIALLTFYSYVDAQKNIYIEVFAQPGFSCGGDYSYLKTFSTSGYEFSNLDKSKTFGINTGVLFGYNLNKHLSISSGLTYAHQGQNYKPFIETLNASAGMQRTLNRSVSLNYFKIPVKLSYIIHPDNKIAFIISGGLYFSLLYNYTDKSEFSDGVSYVAIGASETIIDNNGTTVYDFTNKLPYKFYDFGGLLSAGIQYKLNDKFSIPISIYYEYGFIDIKNTDAQSNNGYGEKRVIWINGSPNMTLPYHNSSFGISIGLKLQLKN